MDVSVTIDGVDALRDRLKGLTDETQKKGGRFAARKAAQVIRDKARENAKNFDDPATPEDISKNVVERFSPRTFRRSGNLAFRIGVLGGARGWAKASGEFQGAGSGNPGGDTFYWRFHEFGTSKHGTKPFLRDAAQKGSQEAVNVFIKEYNRAIDRALRRLAKNNSST